MADYQILDITVQEETQMVDAHVMAIRVQNLTTGGWAEWNKNLDDPNSTPQITGVEHVTNVPKGTKFKIAIYIKNFGGAGLCTGYILNGNTDPPSLWTHKQFNLPQGYGDQIEYTTGAINVNTKLVFQVTDQ